MSKINRQSNFELLKVFSIIMVLILHYFNGGMGGAMDNVSKGSPNYYFMHLLESISIIAVNCFVLVTGYFMAQKQRADLRKAIDLIVLTVFYGVVLYAVFVITRIVSGQSWFGIKAIAQAVIPFYDAKWFVASYIAIYLLSPFINKGLNLLTKPQFKQYLIIVILLFSVIPTVFPIISYNDKGYGILSFVMLYSIGSYLKLHFSSTQNKWSYLFIYAGATTVTFLLGIYLGEGSVGWNYNTIFNLASAVSLFLFFSKLKMNSKLINYLATFTFPVYIIHTDVSLRDLIYHKILKCELYWTSNWFVLHMLMSVAALFLICILLEIIRRWIFKVSLQKLTINIFRKIDIGG